jgi:ABC-type multidrug transport system ATPase subunit
MSTQHIDEADELADRVCIMSHGKVIALGTPMDIKKKFGVGYIVLVEPKASHHMSPSQISARLKEVEKVFISREGFYGITKSIDCTQGKSLFNVPTSLADKIGDLMREVET